MAVINIPRLMLAAPASGSGKTTVTCALLAALAAGHRVQLKQLRDGTIKIQVVSQKELKIT